MPGHQMLFTVGQVTVQYFGLVDILIADYASQNTHSYTYFGLYYSLPNGVTDRLTILAGTFTFSPDEVEVFYLA